MCINNILDLGSRGKAAFLLKGSSKKKRSKEEMEEVKHEETALKQDKQAFLQEFKRLKTNGEHPSVDETEARQNAAVLNNLSRQGIIDDNGNPTQQSKRPQ